MSCLNCGSHLIMKIHEQHTKKLKNNYLKFEFTNFSQASKNPKLKNL